MSNNELLGPMRSLPHPGALVREDVLREMGMTVTRAAELLGVNRSNLSQLLNERQDVTPEPALKLEACFGLEAAMDVAHADESQSGKGAPTSGENRRTYAGVNQRCGSFQRTSRFSTEQHRDAALAPCFDQPEQGSSGQCAFMRAPEPAPPGVRPGHAWRIALPVSGPSARGATAGRAGA